MTMTDLVSRMSDALPRADRAALAWRLLEAEAEEVTFRRDGTRWTAFPWDRMISGPLFVRGNFQGAEIRAVLAWMMRHRRFAAPRDVIVDVGANIGTSTIPFAQDTGCRVISIEPVPEIFAVLCRNVADNGLQSRVTCTQSAVMRAAGGRVQMVLPAGNSGGGEICRADKEPSFAGSIPARGTVEVPAAGLSAILDACRVAPEQVAFVWSDTQGCEAEVIDTGRSLWTAGVPLLAEFVPLLWPDRVAPLLTAARACFVGFIPAAQLTAAAARPRSIAELEEFCGTIGQEGADLLLIPPGTAA